MPGYPCCSFRGSMLALDLNDRRDPLEDVHGAHGLHRATPSGAARRRSTPSAARSTSRPATTTRCPTVGARLRRGRDHDPSRPGGLPARRRLLRLDHGARHEDRRGPVGDAGDRRSTPGPSTASRSSATATTVPDPAGPDYDFGQAPALFTIKDGQGQDRSTSVGAGQKSGQYWALDPDTGAVRWVTQAGPGGTAGGLQWGSAVDGKRVYTANANSNLVPWTLPGGATTTTGVWSGLDAVDRRRCSGRPRRRTAAAPPVRSPPPTASSSAARSTRAGYMYALNGATGAVLWSFPSGGSCLSGRSHLERHRCTGAPATATSASARPTTSCTPSVSDRRAAV